MMIISSIFVWDATTKLLFSTIFLMFSATKRKKKTVNCAEKMVLTETNLVLFSVFGVEKTYKKYRNC